MNHIHELQFVEKGGAQCSTLGCHIYYSEENIIKILERLANENASQHNVQSDDCPSCIGSGKKEIGGTLLTCLACDGTGNRR